MAAVAFVGNMLAPGGAVASGCLLTSTLQSTSTPSPLYSDVGLATPTANPYVADADGRLSFYFDDAISYTWTIKTSDGGTTIWQGDVVGGVLTVTYADGVLIDSSWVLPLATTLGARRGTRFALDELVYYPRDYGCVGDGSTADDTAFWDCVDDARAAGGWVDGEGLTYALSALKTYTGSGVYKWRNLKLKKASQSSTDFECTLRFVGPGFDTNPVDLSSNTSPGDTTFTLDDGTGLAIGQILYLMSDTEYAPSYDVVQIAVGEWIRVQSADTGTGVVTPSARVRSTNTTANDARAYTFNPGLEIWFEDVSFIGGGFDLKQQGLRIDYGVIKQFENVHTIENEYTGIEFEACVFDCQASGVAIGASLDGYGYGFTAAGCFEPQFSQISGYNCRHTVAFGASGGFAAPGGGTIRFHGQGGGVDWVHGEGSTGAVYDTHVGHIGGVVGMVTGSMLPGTGEEAITVQSPDWHFGLIRVIGGDGGVLVQSWGKPGDEPPWKVSFGHIDLGRGGTTTNYGLAIENFDDDNDTTVYATVDSINCWYPGLVILDAEESDIVCHIGHLTGTSRTTHSVYARSATNGKVELTIDRADVTEDSANAAIYAVYAEGTSFEAASAGAIGSKIKIGAGTITADNTACRGNDGDVILDRAVKVTASTFSLSGGTGSVRYANREVLGANRTYYVRADGSDSNTGLADAAAGAFLTIAAAMAAVKALDTNGYDVTVDLSNATRTEAVVFPTLTGGGRLILNGDTSTPANVIISTTSATCITATNVTGRYKIQGVKLQTTTSGNGITATGPGVYIEYESVDFGVIVQHQIAADMGASLEATGNYAISGGAATHLNLLRQGKVTTTSRTVTITNTPAFSTAFANVIRQALYHANSMTFTGSATGKRYVADDLALIFTSGGGASYLPGNATGSTSGGGQYV